MKLHLSAQGKLKAKHLSLFITGRGERKNEGGITWFSGEQRGGKKQSLLTEYKGGGGYKTLTANEGDH